MEDFIQTFHVDWKLLIAQLVNFAIVVLVIWRWALKPLMVLMNQRAQEIDHGLQEAKRIEQELKQLAVTKADVLKEARLQAEEIRQESERRVAQQRQETLVRVKAEAERAVAETRQKFVVEKEQLLQQVKQQAASLVVLATAKVLGKVTTPMLDREVIEQAVKEVANKPQSKL